MNISSASFTNQGDRDYNEDYTIIINQGDRQCFVVADGLGGHGHGEEASQSVCATTKMICESEMGELKLEKIFELSQSNLTQLQQEAGTPDGMKTTMNVVVIDGDTIKWGHIGDTRTYYFRKGKVRERTLDHSVPQMMVNLGEIKEKDIRKHPDRNRLLKVMGIPWDKPLYTLEKSIKVTKCQAFLLCTDGFWELIEEKEMERLLKKAKTPDEWLVSMAEVVKKNGVGSNMDNYSAIAIWID